MHLQLKPILLLCVCTCTVYVYISYSLQVRNRFSGTGVPGMFFGSVTVVECGSTGAVCACDTHTHAHTHAYIYVCTVEPRLADIPDYGHPL